jgi:hypothetical protein
MTDADAAARVDKLLDAIELVKAERRDEARVLLREIISEDADFEEAWLWMAVTVDSLDQSAVCLDNALRINPRNSGAVGALLRVRAPEIAQARQRNRLRFYRDLTVGLMWGLATLLFCAVSARFGMFGLG